MSVAIWNCHAWPLDVSRNGEIAIVELLDISKEGEIVNAWPLDVSKQYEIALLDH